MTRAAKLISSLSSATGDDMPSLTSRSETIPSSGRVRSQPQSATRLFGPSAVHRDHHINGNNHGSFSPRTFAEAAVQDNVGSELTGRILVEIVNADCMFKASDSLNHLFETVVTKATAFLFLEFFCHRVVFVG